MIELTIRPTEDCFAKDARSDGGAGECFAKGRSQRWRGDIKRGPYGYICHLSILFL
jgi:hypothetical protein